MKRCSTIAFLPVVLLSACAGISQGLRTPTVGLSAIVPESVSLDRQVFLVRLDVSNPNAIAIPLTAGQATLSLNGLSVATGSLRDPVTLPAGGRVVAELAVTTSIGRGVGLAAELLANGVAEARYELDASIEAGIGGIGTMRFSDKGRVSLGWEELAVPGRL
jgi:LEA14-like dessication related protein